MVFPSLDIYNFFSTSGLWSVRLFFGGDMGVEDLGFEQVQGPVGTVSEGENSAKENGKLEEGTGHKEAIKFGSHGDEMVNKEGDGIAVPNFPKDAVEE